MDFSFLLPNGEDVISRLFRGFDPLGAYPLGLLVLFSYCILYLGVRAVDRKGWDKIAQLDRLVISIVLSLATLLMFTVTTGVFILIALFSMVVCGVIIAIVMGVQFATIVLDIMVSNMLIPVTLMFSICQTPINMYKIVKYYNKGWNHIMEVGFLVNGWKDTVNPKNRVEQVEAYTLVSVFLIYLSAAAYVATFYLSRVFNIESLIQLTDGIAKMIGLEKTIGVLLMITFVNLFFRLTYGLKWEKKH